MSFSSLMRSFRFILHGGFSAKCGLARSGNRPNADRSRDNALIPAHKAIT
jgi:hypothetical protein